MKISEILKQERSASRNKSIARLYLEGGWYRAYEWSAYLVEFYKNNLSDDNRLKPSHKQVKEVGESIISVGLKLSMMDKFLPGAERSLGDGYIDITTNILDYATESGSEDALLKAWKDNVPVVKSNTVGKIYSQPMSMTSIIKDILSYRMEHTTADEDREFLYALKEKCYSMI